MQMSICGGMKLEGNIWASKPYINYILFKKKCTKMLVSISRNKFTEIRNTTTKQLKKIRGIIRMMLREQKKKIKLFALSLV